MKRPVLQLAVGVALLCGLASCDDGKPDSLVMPDVHGQKLDVALDHIKDAGFDAKVKVNGGGLFGIVRKSNWTVCEQLPAAGSTIANPSVSVDRSCKDEAKATVVNKPKTVTTKAPKVVSAEVSKDVADDLPMVTAPPTTKGPRTTPPLATTPRVTAPPATSPPATSPPATAAPPPVTSPPPPSVYYANCDAARAAGAAPISQGEPGYRPGLDRDKDGVACDA